jgi:hypothetical protein
LSDHADVPDNLIVLRQRKITLKLNVPPALFLKKNVRELSELSDFCSLKYPSGIQKIALFYNVSALFYNVSVLSYQQKGTIGIQKNHSTIKNARKIFF